VIPEARKLSVAPGDQVLLGSPEQPLVTLAADGSRCTLAFEPDATEWVKHPSFPVFFARLAERVPLLAEMMTSVRPKGLLNEEETACRVAGREIRRTGPEAAAAAGRHMELAPWLFAIATLLLAVEWWVVLRKP
jgi:hypothetical protein